MSDILYICDRKACKICCNPESYPTTDINHAYNFKKECLHRDAVSFIELPDHKKDVLGDTMMAMTFSIIGITILVIVLMIVCSVISVINA